jgi:hypothetical protein
MKSISPESMISKTTKIITSNIGDETVMMSIKNGYYYGMNNIGSTIWELLKKPMRVSELCDILTEKFNVSAEKCLKDVIEFLTFLREENLIQVKE